MLYRPTYLIDSCLGKYDMDIKITYVDKVIPILINPLNTFLWKKKKKRQESETKGMDEMRL